MAVYSDKGGYLYSGIGIEGTATANSHPLDTAWIDCRNVSRFMRWYSASSNGPTAGASAIYSLLHSHDKTAFTVLETVTATSVAVATAAYSAGPYMYLALRLNKVYSAAQTGTGHLFLYITPASR